MGLAQNCREVRESSCIYGMIKKEWNFWLLREKDKGLSTYIMGSETETETVKRKLRRKCIYDYTSEDRERHWNFEDRSSKLFALPLVLRETRKARGDTLPSHGGFLTLLHLPIYPWASPTFLTTKIEIISAHKTLGIGYATIEI